MDNLTMVDFPIHGRGFFIARNVAVGITCLLSIVGSLAIMASFVFFRQHRTMTRFLLFNLSLADFLVAIANLVGVSTSYKYIDANETLHATFRNDATCVVTGGLGIYATDSSISVDHCRHLLPLLGTGLLSTLKDS